jgi:hypothetical protein
MRFDLGSLQRFEEEPIWRYIQESVNRQRDEAVAALKSAPKDSLWLSQDGKPTYVRGVEYIQGQLDVLDRYSAIIDMLREQLESEMEGGQNVNGQ